jgi:hypothetical protein
MRRTQIGWWIIAIIAIVDCLIFYQKPDIHAIKIPLAITSSVVLLFYRLTIFVDSEFVRFTFGIGLIRGKYKLSSIKSCRTISYFPMGLGIRWRPGVLLFNVSGTKAIELTINGYKRKIWLGTDVPDELTEFIHSKISTC